MKSKKTKPIDNNGPISGFKLDLELSKAMFTDKEIYQTISDGKVIDLIRLKKISDTITRAIQDGIGGSGASMDMIRNDILKKKVLEKIRNNAN